MKTLSVMFDSMSQILSIQN